MGTAEARRDYDASGGTVDVNEEDAPEATRQGAVTDIWVDIHGVRRELTGAFRPMIDKQGNPLRRRDYLGINAKRELLPPMALLTYAYVPYYYTWNNSTGWKRRGRPKFANNIVARVINLTPKAGDAFYLRMLLMSEQCIGAKCATTSSHVT